MDNTFEKDLVNWLETKGYKVTQPEPIEAESPEKIDPFERVKAYNTYYSIDRSGNVWNCTEISGVTDGLCFKVANYCTDKDLMQQRAYMETLNRLLWRYGVQHGSLDIGISDTHWSIYYDLEEEQWIPLPDDGVLTLVPYFNSEYRALQAIEKIVKPFLDEHPDF